MTTLTASPVAARENRVLADRLGGTLVREIALIAAGTLAMIVLWTGSVYLYRTFRGKIYYIIGMIPATFMSAVTVTYILQAKEGFGLSTDVTYPVGIAAAALFLFLFLRTTVLRHE